jgi:hypothetical protein
MHCATRGADDTDRRARERALALSRFKSSRKDNGYDANGPRIVPVCFHNPQRWGGIHGALGNLFSSAYIGDQKLQKQLEHLNEAFSSQSCCDSRLAWCNK